MATHSSTSISHQQKLPYHLTSTSDDPLHIHVIISTLSGSHTAQTYFDNTLKPWLDGQGLQYRVWTTEDAGSVGRVARDVVLAAALGREEENGARQTVILLSGDGGVVDVVNALGGGVAGLPTATAPTVEHGSGAKHSGSVRSQPRLLPHGYVRPTLALVPCGTANALAHSAGIASDPLKVLVEGSPRDLPMFEAKFSAGARHVTDEGRGRELVSDQGGVGLLFGAVVFSWGLHASLVVESDTVEMRKHGSDRFKMAAQRLLQESYRYRGNVTTLGRAGKQEVLEYGHGQKGEHVYVLAALVSNLEEHFRISPASAEAPLDGKLRLVAFTPSDGEIIARLLGLAYQGGKHVEENNVFYRETEGVRVEVSEDDERWRMVCVDGKIVELVKGGWVEVRMVPKGGEVCRLVCPVAKSLEG